MSAQNYGELLDHAGHSIVIATYGDEDDPENVAIECVDCYEVLLDYDREEN